MKVLNFNGDQFKANKIIKTDTDIIGQDSNGNELFAFRGISDFSGFKISLEDDTECSFDESPKSEMDLMKEKQELMQRALDDLLLGGAL